MRIEIPDQDPYVGFRALIGGEPQVLLHGDDLGSGGSTITTWTARRAGVAASGVGSPTVNASGWAGGGSAVFKTATLNGTSQGIAFNSAASAYAASTALTWVVACKLTASASERAILALGNSSTGNHNRYIGAVVTSDNAKFRSVISGTAESDAGSPITEGAQIIIGATFNGSTCRIVQLASGGETVLVNNLAHSGSGTLTLNTFTLGFWDAVSDTLFTPGEFRFVAALSGVAASDADLSKLLVHTKDKLRCPL